LQFFGRFRAPRGRIGHAADLFVQALRELLGVPGSAAPLAAGVLNGFLPCPLVYAFLAQAAGCGSAVRGTLTMVSFGLGTFPTMLALGALGATWRRRPDTASGRPRPVPVTLRTGASVRSIGWRLAGVRVAGAYIVLLGLATLARGLLPVGRHLHGS